MTVTQTDCVPTDDETARGTDAPGAGIGSIVDRFRQLVERQPDRVALRSSQDGDWRTISWRDYGVAVAETAAGLIELGIEPGDRVAIAAANRPEWQIADLAILSVGGVSVPIYPTSSSSQVEYVLANSATRVCFVDDAEQLAKVLLHLSELPDLERLVVLGGSAGFDRPGLVMSLAELRESGDPSAVDERAAAIDPDDLATLVYTSGTTGPPKGVRISHANLTWTIDAVEQMIGLHNSDRMLSYLPLSHIAERLTSHFGMIAAGGETWFARSLATVPEDLRVCRPTIFMAVPRVWQKLHDAILDQLDVRPVDLGPVLEWAAKETEDAGRSRRSPVNMVGSRARAVAAHTLARLVRRRLGLDRARLLVSAAAPIHADLLRWFDGIGLPIAEVYGQTEDCGPATINPPDAIRIGSVGRPIPGLEVSVADDGELLLRGGSVCRGYHELPDETGNLIDDEGWMHSGDLGRVDADGYVWLTGRKKDLIINAAGKNISPSQIETRFSMEPLIGQAVVVGDGRRYLTALLSLDADAAAEWARDHGTFNEMAELGRHEGVRREIEAAVQRVNREHAPVEQIKYWRLLPEQLSVDNGELTPTLKVKREVITERHADLIETMYAEDLSRSDRRSSPVAAAATDRGTR